MKSSIFAFFTGFTIFILAAAAMRALASAFGNSALNSIAIGFALLLGLVLGIAYFSSQRARAGGGPRALGLIHLAAAICLLVLITVLPAMHRAYGFVHSLGPSSPGALGAVRFVLTVLVLIVPAFLLGGSLASAALMNSHPGRAGAGHALGAAFLGLALAVPAMTLFMLPRWGTSIALAVAAIVLAGMSAAGLLARGAPGFAGDGRGGARAGGPGMGLAEVGALLISFSTVCHMLLGMRLLHQVTGVNAYTFVANGMVLSLGIFIGCAAVGRLLRSTGSGRYYTGLFALAAALFLFAVLGTVDAFPVRFLSHIDSGNAGTGGFMGAYLYLAVILFPVPAALLGATLSPGGPGGGALPDLRRRLLAAGSGAALAFALALPALAAGLGLESACVLAAWLVLAGGAALSAASGAATGLKLTAVLPALAIAIILTATRTPWNRAALTSGVHDNPHNYAGFEDVAEAIGNRDIMYYQEDLEGIVTVARTPDGTFLRLNGKTVGSASENIARDILAAHIPMLLHKDPESVLLLGLGTGVTLGSVQRYEIKRATAVEPVAAVSEAAPLFSPYNYDALEDRRTGVVIMGPRQFMRLTDETFDVIIYHAAGASSPVHASALTVDFMLLARSVLQYDGVFCYVVNLADISRNCLMTTVSAFMTAFPYVTAWYAGGSSVALAGSMEAFDISEARTADRLERPWVSNDLKRLQISDGAGLLANLMMNRESLRAYLGAFSGRNTDSRPGLACDAVPVQSPTDVIASLADINKFSLNAVEILSDFEEGSTDFKLARNRYNLCREARNYYIGSYLALAAGEAREASRRLEHGVSLCATNGLLKGRLSHLYIQVSRDLDAVGRFEEAINVARRAIEVRPASYLAFYNLAALERKRDPDTAIGLLERLSQLNPDFLIADILKAQLMLETGRVNDASEVISEVLSKEPMNPEAHHVRALCFIERGLTEAARVELEFVLEARPGNAEAHAALGYTWLLVGDINEAEKHYARALALAPENLGVLNNYATILAEKGDYREAIVIWQRALRLDPANEGIKANIQEAKQKMGEG